MNRVGIETEFRHSAPIFHDELRRAVRKGNTALLRTVSEGFSAIESGELKQIDEKWFGRTLNRYGRYLTYAGYAAAAAMLLIAGSETARIRLRSDAETLVLEIEDRGHGIPNRSLKHITSGGGGVGIASMSERIEQLGGHLEITSSDHDTTGTSVRVWLPLTNDAG